MLGVTIEAAALVETVDGRIFTARHQHDFVTT